MKIKKLIYYSLIAAVYTCLSLVLGSFSFGPIQIRIAEVLMVLCIYDKEYILPLSLGCFLTNLIGVLMGLNVFVLDIIFGSLATIISGCLMYLLRDIKLFNKPLVSLLIPSIINGIIVGSELALYLSNFNTLHYFVIYPLYVFLGEFVSCFILGLILFKPFSTLQAYIRGLN